jgi:hypothetical protein
LNPQNLTAAQFAWACCQAGDFPPPAPKRGPRFGLDAQCCLCGGATEGVGWPRKLGVSDTFTDIPGMPMPASQTVCQACVATSKSDGWGQSVAAHPERGLKATFDQKEGKAARGWNWLYSHHLFVWPDHHECPDRARWRALLANPPPPPFLAILTTSGKKQLIFKSRLAWNRDVFPLQFEDESVLVAPSQFSVALADFMRLYLLGFSKDSVLSGNYHPASLMTAGAERWREAEAPASVWRRQHPQLWAVCHYVAQRPEDWEPPQRPACSAALSIPSPANPPPSTPAPPQGSLF